MTNDITLDNKVQLIEALDDINLRLKSIKEEKEELEKPIDKLKEELVTKGVIDSERPVVFNGSQSITTFTFIEETHGVGLLPFKEIKKMYEIGKIPDNIFEKITKNKSRKAYVKRNVSYV